MNHEDDCVVKNSGYCAVAVVMGGDSLSEGHGFESQHHILDGHFFTLICCKICNDVCLERPKISDNEIGKVYICCGIILS